MGSQPKLYESHAEDCTRVAEQTYDVPCRKMLLLLALQWKLAAEEAGRYQNRVKTPLCFHREFGRVTSFVALGLFLVATPPARADVRILASPGGEVGSYIKLSSVLRQSGQRVIVDGPCFSACTLVLSSIPRNRICVTPKAVLGFHAPRWVDGQSRQYAATAENLSCASASLDCAAGGSYVQADPFAGSGIGVDVPALQLVVGCTYHSAVAHLRHGTAEP